MAMEITNNYSNYAAQGMAESRTANSAKKKETEKTTETAGSSKAKKTTDYANELAKLVPSAEFRTGYAPASDKRGETLTINPKLLEKMQNDPAMEKEMKELIAGVEKMIHISEAFNKATGWTTVYRHSYIDENGKYCHIAMSRNDYMLNLSDKLREERRENSEKLIEKSKEKAAEKKEELEEALEEKKAAEAEEGTEEKVQEESAYNKAEQLLEEKMAASKDGTIYLNDADMKTFIDAAKEDNAGKTTIKDQAQVGVNLDLKI